jgi:S1-C subfamily serine protease
MTERRRPTTRTLALLLALCAATPAALVPRAVAADWVLDLGLRVAEASRTTLREQGLAYGVVVRSVLPATPAGAAGLRAGDLITTLDGEPVRSPADLERLLERAGDAEVVTLELYRDGNEISRDVRLRPPDRRPGIG